MTFALLSPHIFEGIGVVGFCLYVLNYTLLTMRILTGNSVHFFAINLTAALCVLIGLTVSFNLASALIQSFWIVMSLVGITLNMVRPSGHGL